MKYSAQIIGLLTSILATQIVAAETSHTDNIIVSAYRTPAKKIDLGSTVSTIDKIDFEERQTVFIADVLQDLPGIAVSRGSNAGSQTQVRIRGSEANHVLVRINGIKVNDPAAGDEFGFAHLTAFDIGRVEVVRGPQSALWGSDAVAGVIDIRTRRATQPLETVGFLEGGAFNTVNGGVLLGTASETSSLNFSSSYFDTDGTNISRTGDEDDGYRNWTSTLTGDWQLANNLKVDATIRYTDSVKEIDNDTDFDGLQEDVDRETDQTQLIAGLGGEIDLLDGFWTQSLRGTFLSTENDDILDNATTITADIDRYGAYYQSNLNFDSGPSVDSTQVITLGVDFEREEFSQRGESLFGDPNQDQSMNNLGLVAEYRATDFGGFSFSLGLRHDDNNEFDNITTYRATTSYQVTPVNGRIHASYGTGQKNPTFTERFGLFPDQFSGNPDLKPEKSKGFDIGYTQAFGADRISADVTYFNSKLEDEINGFAFDVNSGMFTAENRDGTSKRKGIETDLSAQITDNLVAYASYTYTDASQPDDTGVQEREIRRPRHMASFNTNYDFYRDKAQVNLNVSYTGSQTDLDFGPFPAETVRLDAYTLVNLAARLNLTENISINGRVENLFDKTYENIYSFATQGIGAYIGIRVEFSR